MRTFTCIELLFHHALYAVLVYVCNGGRRKHIHIPIPEAEITMQTRKGVEVTYAPASLASATV